MDLPFTKEQFFDLFAAYNAPIVAGTAGAVDRVCCWQRTAFLRTADAQSPGQCFAGNALGLVWQKAALFFWEGVVRDRLSFAARPYPQGRKSG